MKVRATSLSKTRQRGDANTPIKEEDVEEEFEEGGDGKSKGTSGFQIEEAQNYDSNTSMKTHSVNASLQQTLN